MSGQSAVINSIADYLFTVCWCTLSYDISPQAPRNLFSALFLAWVIACRAFPFCCATSATVNCSKHKAKVLYAKRLPDGQVSASNLSALYGQHQQKKRGRTVQEQTEIPWHIIAKISKPVAPVVFKCAHSQCLQYIGAQVLVCLGLADRLVFFCMDRHKPPRISTVLFVSIVPFYSISKVFSLLQAVFNFFRALIFVWLMACRVLCFCRATSATDCCSK